MKPSCAEDVPGLKPPTEAANSDVRSQVSGIRWELTGMGVTSFEELEVFQRAYRLSLEVHRASLKFPKIEQYALADQVRKASKSIAANIAEGFGKQGRRSNFGGGRVPAVPADRHRLGRRDAGVGALLPGPGLHRRGDVAALARRIPSNRKNASSFGSQVRDGRNALIPDTCLLTSEW